MTHTQKRIFIFALIGVGVLFVATIANRVTSWQYHRGITDVMMQSDRSEVGFAGAPAIGMMQKIAPEMMPPVYPQPGAPYDERQNVEQKIIKNGSISIRVEKADDAFTKIKDVAGKFNGFVSQAQLTDDQGTKRGYITLRVPVAKLEEATSAVRKLALVIFDESVNATDATAEYVDLSARLKASRAEEEQYLSILKQARSVEDTLKVTQHLSEVRARIEQLQGQMRYLTDRTDYATLSITLTEETRIHVPTRTWKPLETIRLAFSSLIVTLQGLVDLIITAFIFLIGFLAPLLLVLYFLYWLLKKAWFGVIKK